MYANTNIPSENNFEFIALEDSISMLIENNSEIKEASLNIKSAQHNLTSEFRKWFPTIELSMQSQYQKNNPHPNSQSDTNVPSYIPDSFSEAYKSLILPSDSQRYSNQISAHLSQVILDNGEIGNSIKAAQSKLDIANANLKVIRNDAVFDTINLYSNLLLTHIDLSKLLLKKNQIKGEVDLKKSMLDSEYSSLEELKLKEFELKFLEIDISQVKIKLSSQKEEFLDFIGASNETIQIKPQQLDSIYKKSVFDHYISSSENLRVAEIEAKSNLNESQILLAKSLKKPKGSINIIEAWNKTHESAKESLNSFDNQFFAYVMFSWRLFDSGTNHHKVKGLEGESEVLKLQKNEIQKTTNNRINHLKKEISISIKRNSIFSEKLHFISLQLNNLESQIKSGVSNEHEKKLLEYDYALTKLELQKNMIHILRLINESYNLQGGFDIDDL
tara:strand:+ start:2031 stop:3365 length:1335 start_codon:yes stop_codon:yes gene_type:complete